MNVRRSGWVLTMLLGLALAGCSDDSGSAQGQGQKTPPPLKAQVFEVTPKNLPVDKEYSALLRSEQEVTVVARVSGVLQERQFDEGARVEEGQSLFVIEPDRYQTLVRQREADMKSAQAENYRAQRNWDRYQQLYQQKSISQQQRDEARADLLSAQAAVAQAQAALDDAQLDLDYSTVEAPLSGQISLSEVNVGNLVQPQQTLATITPLETVQARFSLTPEDAIAIRRQRQSDSAPTITPVAMARNGQRSADQLSGELTYLGSRVDRSTGTVEVEATFSNPEALFLPGQFVRLKLAGLVLPDVLAVPEIAVTEGREGPQVFVLDDKGQAKPITVNLGERSNAWVVVQRGLEAGQRVVVSKIPSVQPGRKIDAQPFDGKAEATGEKAQQSAQAQDESGQDKGAKQQAGDDQAQGAEG